VCSRELSKQARSERDEADQGCVSQSHPHGTDHSATVRGVQIDARSCSSITLHRPSEVIHELGISTWEEPVGHLLVRPLTWRRAMLNMSLCSRATSMPASSFLRTLPWPRYARQAR